MLLACLHLYAPRHTRVPDFVVRCLFISFLHPIRCVEASQIFASCLAFSVFIVPLCDGSDDAVIGHSDGWIMGTMIGTMGLID